MERGFISYLPLQLRELGLTKFDYRSGGRDKWLARIHGIELSQITPAKIQDWKQSFLAAAGEFTALPYSPAPWQPIRQRRL
jgi:hypothetical protein